MSVSELMWIWFKYFKSVLISSAIIHPVFVVSFFNRLMYVGSSPLFLHSELLNNLFNEYCYNLCFNILLLLSRCTIVFFFFLTRYTWSLISISKFVRFSRLVSDSTLLFVTFFFFEKLYLHTKTICPWSFFDLGQRSIFIYV